MIRGNKNRLKIGSKSMKKCYPRWKASIFSHFARKSSPTGSRDAPGGPRRPQEAPQGPPRDPRDAPKTRPGRFPRGSRTCPGRPKTPSGSPRTPPGRLYRLQEPPRPPSESDFGWFLVDFWWIFDHFWWLFPPQTNPAYRHARWRERGFAALNIYIYIYIYM